MRRREWLRDAKAHSSICKGVEVDFSGRGSSRSTSELFPTVCHLLFGQLITFGSQ